MNLDAALKKRDTRLRRKAINTLRMARHVQRGGLTGKALMESINDVMPPGEQFENEQHALAIFRSLKEKGLIAESEEKGRRRLQAWGIEWLFYTLTAEGESLWNETLPPDPDIDDERNL